MATGISKDNENIFELELQVPRLEAGPIDSETKLQSEPTVYAISGLYDARSNSLDGSLIDRSSIGIQLSVDSPDVSVCQFGCIPHHGHCSHLQYTELKPEKSTEELEDVRDCGYGSFRPRFLQRFANIRVFVFLQCLLAALQQMLSSGYFNSVITTIEKRFDIPSAVSGTIASTYEIGNLVTIIFVSYLGTHRHIPVWIGKGTLLMGVGAILFTLPHFIDQQYNLSGGMSSNGEYSEDGKINFTLLHTRWDRETTCRAAIQGSAIGSSDIASEACEDDRSSNVLYVFIFMMAQMLIGCGGSPIFTLGTTYIDDHIKKESSSMYIGCIYSMVAFGLVCGYLLGGYLLSIHHNILFFETSPMEIYPGHPRWIGAWWGGFLICGCLLMLVSIPFFSFPKSLERDKVKVKKWEELVEASRQRRRERKAIRKLRMSDSNKDSRHKRNPSTSSMPVMPSSHHHNQPLATQSSSGSCNLINNHRRNQSSASWSVMLSNRSHHQPTVTVKYNASSDHVYKHRRNVSNDSCLSENVDEAATPRKNIIDYGKNVRDIPKCMMKLLCNPVYVVTCLGSCMELAIVSGFVIFLPKYLETQFSMSNSQANLFTGGIAIPGACVGIFMGGYLLKRYQLRPKGAVQLVLVFIVICMALFTLFFFLGCENVKMAGATMPYYNTSGDAEVMGKFQVNLTADCNMDCRCTQENIEPVCGRNGLTYFSPCHAGCTAELGKYPHQNFTNCACIPDNATVREVTAVPLARNGPCPNVCQAIIPFMVLLFIMTLVVSITQMPLLMIMLRSVDQDERSFALGMQFVIFRLFAYIPAPILFGNVIDSTCLLWKAHCGEMGGFCLVYDIETFRYKYVGISSALKIISGMLFLLDWYLICSRYKEDEVNSMGVFSVDEIMASLSSLDLSGDHGIHTLTEDRSPLNDRDSSDNEHENQESRPCVRNQS